MSQHTSWLAKVVSVSLLALSAIVPATKAQAQVPTANYYVANTGSDTNAGTAAAPFATISKALSLSTGGQTIAVASGSYNAISDSKTRTSNVTVLGYGATPPVVTSTGNSNGYAASLNGAQGLIFDNFKFTDTLFVVSKSVTTGSGDTAVTTVTQPTKNITVRNCEITNTGVAVYLYTGTQNITFDNNWIHGVSYGFFTQSRPVVSTGITITNNLIEDLTTDGIQFCRWNNVLIDGNVIRNIYKVSGDLHNDCIQMSGDSQNVTISNNILYQSGTQILMIKPDWGPIDNLTVQNNLIFNAEAVAVQISNSTGVKVVNNTIWNKGFGLDGMYLRGATTTGAIIANNCFSTFHKMDGATVAFEDYNFATQTGLYGPHDILNSNASWPTGAFVNSAAGDYHPSATSQLKSKGTSTYAPALDLDGATRSTTLPTIGAYEGGFAPQSATLALWLKADAGVTANSSGFVSAWADQSGNGRNAVQPTSSQQPGLEANAVNGKPALVFSGDFLTFSSISSSKYHVFSVVKPSIGITSKASILAGNTGSFHYAIDQDYKQRAGKSYTTLLGVSNTEVPTTAFSRLNVSYGNPALNFALNGVADGSLSAATTFSSSLTLIGARNGTDYYKGYIAEVLVFTAPVSRAKAAGIENYLAAKYAL